MTTGNRKPAGVAELHSTGSLQAGYVDLVLSNQLPERAAVLVGRLCRFGDVSTMSDQELSDVPSLELRYNPRLCLLEGLFAWRPCRIRQNNAAPVDDFIFRKHQRSFYHVL